MNSLDTKNFKNYMIENGLDVQIGSFYKYNNSNVNDLRKDHIVKDNISMSAYCSEKKIIKGH